MIPDLRRNLFAAALHCLCAALAAASGSAGAQGAKGNSIAVAAFSRLSPGAVPPPWQPYIIVPSNLRTSYRLIDSGEGVALEARAERSSSGLYRPLRVNPARYPVLEWRWRVDALIPDADPRVAAREDSPARLLISFDGDFTKIGAVERAKMRLAESRSGQTLPYAMLMYIWANAIERDSVISHPHLGRFRMIVVESGAGRLGRWIQYRRNVVADYRRAFSEEPGTITAVGLLTDADNTQQSARCLYGDISFSSAKK